MSTNKDAVSVCDSGLPTCIFLGLAAKQHKPQRRVATPFAMCWLSRFSRVQLFTTPWTVARQTPLSVGFSTQEYWSGLPCPPPEYLPDTGIRLGSLLSPALAGRFFNTNATWKALLANKDFKKVTVLHRWARSGYLPGAGHYVCLN